MKRLFLIFAWGLVFYVMTLGVLCLAAFLYFFLQSSRGKQPLGNSDMIRTIGAAFVIAPMVAGIFGSVLAFTRKLPGTSSNKS